MAESADPLFSRIASDPIGQWLVEALRLVCLAGIESFSAATAITFMTKARGEAPPASAARARLRLLAEHGYLKQTGKDRYHIQPLFACEGGVAYRRAMGSGEPIWLARGDTRAAKAFSGAEKAAQRGDYEEARRLLAKVARGGGARRTAAYHRLAMVELAAGRRESAELFFTEAFKSGAASEALFTDYAMARAALGDRAGAVATLREGAGLLRRSGTIHERLDELYRAGGDRYRAVYHRFQTILSDADLIPPQAALADELADEGALETASMLYRKAARGARRNAYPLYRLAYLYANRLHDRAAAVEMFGRILRIQPDDAVAHENRARLERGESPLPETIVARHRGRRYVWRSERPGQIETFTEPLA